MDEERLLERLRKGEQAAYKLLVSTHQGSMRAVAIALVGHWLQSPISWHSDSPEALLDEQELRECLEHTLTSLSELQRSVIMLRDRQCLELEEICNLLDISHSNVRVLLHRARLSVFATLDHFEVTGEC